MRTGDQLAETVRRMDGKGYRTYKDIRGSYSFGDFELHIEHVQGDPFAEPTRVSVTIASDVAALPQFSIQDSIARRASADFLNRQFCKVLARHSTRSGSGKSGLIQMLEPGQQVLERTSLRVDANGEVRARFLVGLPANGRRIAGRLAQVLLTESLGDCVREALVQGAWDIKLLQTHCEAVQDSVALREALKAQGLIAFVGDGACLPRRSGADDRPVSKAAVLFESPQSLRVTLDTAHSGKISGMGIAQGVTLIVGGGYHGKSTLLRAIERGHLDHIPGDGRERVVATEDAVKIRAEDGRSVVHTDISAFITNLPSGDDTTCFSTTNASGSTSQAAAIAEALEMGASTLLLDEDTCATNFMIRDLRMQKLVAKDDEPITPFLDRVRGLYENGGVSSLLVMGGAGDYFDVADTVIMMKQYRPLDVTQQARLIASELVSTREPCHLSHVTPKKRRANFRSLGASAGPKGIKVRVRDIDLMSFGREDVRIACVEQLVEKAQVRAIGQALLGLSEGALTKQQTLREALDDIESMVHTEGLESITRRVSGDLAWFRKYELAAVLTRLRTLKMNKPT